jgi:hypothetical protein
MTASLASIDDHIFNHRILSALIALREEFGCPHRIAATREAAG